MEAAELVSDLARKARVAWRSLASASDSERALALTKIAEELEARTHEILSANEKDLERAKAENLNSQLIDRLMLNEVRIKAIANGARKVALLPDPVVVAWSMLY